MTAHQDAQDGQQMAPPAGVASVPTVDAAAVLRDHMPRMLVFAGDEGGPWACSVDWTAWRGDAETGGCDTVLLAREVVALRERAGVAFIERDVARGEALDRFAETVQLARAWRNDRGRVALLEGLLRDLAAKGEAMKAALFTGDDNREAIACMEWDDAAAAALAEGG